MEADDPHDMTMRLRLANTNWFCRWFQNRKGPETEPDFRLETAADVNCLPNGSIRYSRKGDTIYSIIQREAERRFRHGVTMPPGKCSRASARCCGITNRTIRWAYGAHHDGRAGTITSKSSNFSPSPASTFRPGSSCRTGAATTVRPSFM